MRWVIGDIHGMLRPLRALLAAVRAADPAAAFYFTGDYVNRGPDSRGVIDLLLSLPEAKFVRGNHDDILDMILHGDCFAPQFDVPDPITAFMWFVQHGLRETLLSYGADSAEIDYISWRPTDAGIVRLFAAMPPAHRTFIRELPAVVENDDFFVLHAYWDPDDMDDVPPISARLASEPWLRQKVLWGRYTDELTRRKRWQRTGYFGHTPVEVYPPALRGGENVPIREQGIVLLDTGAALSPTGRLSAVCADDLGRIIQVDRLGSVVGEV